MSKPKESKHMSNLPPLQKLIILHMAKTKPQTMNRIAKEISKEYKSTWTAFKSLERKKLIDAQGTKPNSKTEYKCYWLTGEGMIMALLENANSEKLLEQTKVLYPDNTVYHCFLEMMPFIHPEITRMAYSSVKGKGKLGFSELSKLCLAQAASILIDAETAKNLTAILKKYPEEYSKLKTAVKSMIDQLSQLIAE
jgi:hypothetical protein